MNNERDNIKKFVEQLIKQLKSQGIDVNGGAIIGFRDGNPNYAEGFGTMKPSEIEKSLPDLFQDFNKNMTEKDFEERVRDKYKDDVKSAMENIVNKLKSGGFNIKADQKKQNTETQKENIPSTEDICTCSECLKYDNFEELLAHKKGTFDYSEVTLGGKRFKIKYHISPDGNQNIVISDWQEKAILEELNLEDLNTELSQAIQLKNFEKAQIILSIIKERKNKN